jgi:glycerophosphoryl diester phosphodiesterase
MRLDEPTNRLTLGKTDRVSRLLSVLASTFVGCTGPLVEPEQGPPFRCPVFVAHRAGAREVGVPDNSLAAFEAARADSLKVVEVDVRWSRDNEAVLFHDRRLSRGPWSVPGNLAGQEVAQVSSEALKRICAPGVQKGCVLPFTRMLDVMQLGGESVQLDLKGSPKPYQLASLFSEIAKRSLEERVIIFCDPFSEYHSVRAKSAAIRVMVRVHDEGELEWLLRAPPWAVQVDEEMLRLPVLNRLREKKVLVMVKTLEGAGDDPRHWESLRARGTDMILTDFPRAARRAICDR